MTKSLTSLRLGFAGTPQFAADILQGLLAHGYTFQVVYTQPDRASGRRRKVLPSAVKKIANEQGLPVEQPKSLRNAEAQSQLSAYQLDLWIVAAYGLILPQVVLDTPSLGCINVHASLLPRWRGAAPIERAIMAGDAQTGVSIMQMEAGIDTGPVFLAKSLPIGPDTTGVILTQDLAKLGVSALHDILPEIQSQHPTPQDDTKATHAKKLEANDSIIDWQNSATTIDAQIRALCGRAPAVSEISHNNESIRVQWLAANADDGAGGAEASPGTILNSGRKSIVVQCGQGELALTSAKINKGKGTPMNAAALKNGYGAWFAADNQFAPINSHQ